MNLGYADLFFERAAHLLKKAADDARSKSGGDKGDPLGTANPTQLGRAQKKYREFYKRANTKYERLHAIDKKNKLTVHPTEHAFFVHLCALREGMLHEFFLNPSTMIRH